MFEKYPILIRGAGEHASAVAWHLHKAGFRVAMTELPEPLAVRRLVAFSQATREGAWSVEGVSAKLCEETLHLDTHGKPGDEPAPCIDAEVAGTVRRTWDSGDLALVIDAGLDLLDHIDFFAIVDARMLKTAVETIRGRAPLTVGLGPGIRAGEHVDVVVETLRGHDLGRIITEGPAAPDTGLPGEVEGESADRVYHMPCEGRFWAHVQIGQMLRKGDLIGVCEGDCDKPCTVVAKIPGRVRGLIADGEVVPSGAKVADIDPRGEQIDPSTISEKGRCIAAGVLTALGGAIASRL